ncbi:hypothetical protein [Candidatus Phycorickettsia trachydisci]|nr:hypothetical protein [Candidatus Phycorickettsia trachydisci]
MNDYNKIFNHTIIIPELEKEDAIDRDHEAEITSPKDNISPKLLESLLLESMAEPLVTEENVDDQIEHITDETLNYYLSLMPQTGLVRQDTIILNQGPTMIPPYYDLVAEMIEHGLLSPRSSETPIVGQNEDIADDNAE